MELVEHVEGRTRLVVPSASLALDPPPTAPVFFNPAASLNRDITVAITASTGGSTFCDSMSGVGARGLRVAKEVDRIEKVTMVDLNAAAVEAAKGGAALNNVVRKCEFSNFETTSYLFSRHQDDEKFDYVDVDPFGTPVRQFQAAVWAASDGGLVSVTATDTAVLCGVYPQISEKRYGAVSLKNHFDHEIGIRILAGALARQAAHLDVGIEPVYAHSTRHYIRLYARVVGGASRADVSLGRLGYLIWCPGCGHVASSDAAEVTCQSCGKKARLAGPLWLHGLTDPKMLKVARETAARISLGSASRTIGMFEGLDDYPPWSFSIERASSSLKVATVPESEVCRALWERGWRTMRTPFEMTGIKTDAPYEEFLHAVSLAVWARGRGTRMAKAQHQGDSPSQK